MRLAHLGTREKNKVNLLAPAGKTGRYRAALGVAVAALLVVAALVWGYANRAGAVAAPLEKISIAVSSTPHAALLHLAAAQGLFAEEGLDATLVPVSHGKAAMDLLAQRKVDVAAAAEVPFVIAVLNGEPFSVAATMVSVSSEMAIVARRDRNIVGVQDLVGKKVGVTLGTSGDYFLWAFLIRHRIQPDAITFVELAPGQMAKELARGAIDAVSTWQPIRFGAETALGANAVSFIGADAYAVTHVVVARHDFLQAHRPAMSRLVRALMKAEAFSRDKPQQAMALVAERLKIDAKALQTGWPDLDFKVELLQSQLIAIEDEARWAMARGYAPKGAVPNFLPNLYLDALLDVKAERVTVVH